MANLPDKHLGFAAGSHGNARKRDLSRSTQITQPLLLLFSDTRMLSIANADFHAYNITLLRQRATVVEL